MIVDSVFSQTNKLCQDGISKILFFSFYFRFPLLLFFFFFFTLWPVSFYFFSRVHHLPFSLLYSRMWNFTIQDSSTFFSLLLSHHLFYPNKIKSRVVIEVFGMFILFSLTLGSYIFSFSLTTVEEFKTLTTKTSVLAVDIEFQNHILYMNFFFFWTLGTF